jgi:hypothetical protein
MKNNQVKKDDCGCGKKLKPDDPRLRKNYQRTIKKK